MRCVRVREECKIDDEEDVIGLDKVDNDSLMGRGGVAMDDGGIVEGSHLDDYGNLGDDVHKGGITRDEERDMT